MRGSGKFSVPGSPLDGRRVPQDWARMDPNGKRRALVAYEYATSYEGACRLMGQHAAAVMRARRLRDEHAAKARHPEGKD